MLVVGLYLVDKWHEAEAARLRSKLAAKQSEPAQPEPAQPGGEKPAEPAKPAPAEELPKAITVNLSIRDIVADTRVEESMIFTAVNSFNKSGIFTELGIDDEKNITFRLDYPKFREFLKTICHC
jgi:hypothetical protein